MEHAPNEPQTAQVSDLMQRARQGEQAAFAELSVEQGCPESIQTVIRELTAPDTSLNTRTALYQHIVKALFCALPEYDPVHETFAAWCERTAKASIVAERILILRAQKGDREAFAELLVNYRSVLTAVVQEYAPTLPQYDEKTLFAGLVEDAFRGIRTLRIHSECLALWLQKMATESCQFLHIQQQARAGDQDRAFQALSTLYEPFIRHIMHQDFPKLKKEDQDEVEQQVKLRMWVILPIFREKGYSFRCWLRKTTHGLCLNKINRQKRIEAYEKTTEIPETIPDLTENQAEHYLSQEEEELLGNAIRLLPEIYQDVLYLREIERLSYEEIAAILAIPLGTVQSRIHEGRNLITQIRRIVEEGNIPFQTITSQIHEQGIRLTKVLKELYTQCFTLILLVIGLCAGK